MKNNNIHTPEGLRDIYGKEIEEKVVVQKNIMDSIRSFGYKNIQTPTFEFLEVYGKEVGSTPINAMYKFCDKDGNLLALRPDFTPSIVRCASKFYNSSHAPIRLCYMGNSFNNRANLQGRLNETTQIGAELIGDDSIYADAEMINMAVVALLSTGLKDFQISICEVEYFKGLCDELLVKSDVKEELAEYISKQNYFAAEELLRSEGISEENIEKILCTRQLIGNENILAKAKGTVTNEVSLGAISRLEKIYSLLCSYKVERYVSIDFSMISKYKYYSGIIFKGYTYGIGEVIVTGGRYNKLMGQFGMDAPAIGFMCVIDNLLVAMRSQKIGITVDENEALILYNEENFEKAVSKQTEMRGLGYIVTLLAYSENLKYQDAQYVEIIRLY